MNTLAARLGAVNLGHGYADDPPLSVMVDVAKSAMANGDNQYTPTSGLEALRIELARRMSARGLAYDSEDEITVTIGCTGALAATIFAHAPPGSEIITLEPFYDSYPIVARLAGAKLVPVRIGNVLEGELAGDLTALREAINPATQVLLLNSPHNPTGLTLSGSHLRELAELAIENDLVVVSDDVYEELVFERPHERIAGLDGMRERTVVCSSITKTLSVSGWRVGWACGPPHLTAPIRDAQQGFAYCAPTPLQHGAAAALRWADDDGYFDRLRDDYRGRRDMLVDGLTEMGLKPVRPRGGYFVVADARPWSQGMGADDFAIQLAHRAGVVAMPMTPFVAEKAAAEHLLRFAFCKSPMILDEALRRLRQYVAGR